MTMVEKKVDELADMITKSLKEGSINSVLVECIKSLEMELIRNNEKLKNNNES